VDVGSQKRRRKKKKNKDFAIVSLDESFFFYYTLVRCVWIDENKRPIVRVTGSHKHSCLFGAISMDQKQIFRQYDEFNGDTFIDFLKRIHHKFTRCYLFMDKAPITSLQIKKGERVLGREQGYSYSCIPTYSVT
jgi:hypothetical protein